MIDIKVPTVGESISEVTLLNWNKKDGEYVNRDEVIAELESEKATFEVNAEEAGVLKHGAYKEGDTINIGDVLAQIDETAEKSANEQAQPKEEAPAKKTEPEVATTTEVKTDKPKVEFVEEALAQKKNIKASPVASAMIADKKIDTAQLHPSGPSGKILKEDVLAALSNPGKNTFNGAALFSRNVRKEK
nr:E3 binding domain-containing protein [Chitinophagaceae bacterium]